MVLLPRDQLCIFLVTSISTISCFIPWILGWNLYGTEPENMTDPIFVGISSNAFLLALACSSSISLTMVFDTAILASTDTILLFKGKGFVHLVLCIALVVPNILIIGYVIHTMDVIMLLILLRVRLIIVCSVIIAFINKIVASSRSRTLSFLTIFMISMSRITAVYLPFCSKYYERGLSVTQSTVQVLSVLSLIILCVHWLNHFRGISLTRDLLSDEYLSCTYITALLLLVPGISSFTFSNEGSHWKEFDTTYLVGHIVLYTIIFILFNIFQRRSTQREIFLSQNALETKRMYSRYMSHELRTPLNGVVIGLQLLRDQHNNIITNKECHYRATKEDEIELIDDIYKSCEIAINILDNMLTNDFLESHSLVLERNNVNIKKLIEEIIQTYVRQGASVGVDVAFIPPVDVDVEVEDGDEESKLTNDSYVVCADRHKLAQAIGNLIGNALKFTDPGGNVSVAIRKVSTIYGTKIRVTVQDTGYGMSNV